MNTGRRLREALVALMQDTPVDKISVQAVCEAADVSKQTFYRHYADKYALLEEAFSELVLRPFEQESAQLRWTEGLVSHFRRMREHEAFVRNGYLSSDVNGLFQADVRLTREVLEGILRAHGADPADTLLHFAMDVELYGTIYLVRDWVLAGMRTPEEELASLIVQTMPEVLKPYLLDKLKA